MGKLLELFYTLMGVPTQVSENTNFVYEDGKLVPVDEEIKTNKKKELRRQFSKRHLAEDEYWMNIPDAIREREYPIFQTIRVYVLDKVAEYIMLKAEDSKTNTSVGYQNKEFMYKDLAKEILSSQVLDRLISGKELLKSPPPKSYFHYWYDLVDDGEGVCIDVSFTKTKKYVGGQDTEVLVVRIDGEEWKNLKELDVKDGDPEYILQWKDTDYFYKLSRMDGEDYERLLHPYQRKQVTKDHYSWKLTRIEKGDFE